MNDSDILAVEGCPLHISIWIWGVEGAVQGVLRISTAFTIHRRDHLEVSGDWEDFRLLVVVTTISVTECVVAMDVVELCLWRGCGVCGTDVLVNVARQNLWCDRQ